MLVPRPEPSCSSCMAPLPVVGPSRQLCGGCPGLLWAGAEVWEGSLKMGESWSLTQNWVKSHCTPKSIFFYLGLTVDHLQQLPINMLILTADFLKLFVVVVVGGRERDPNVLILFLSLSSLGFSHSALCWEEQNFNNSLIHFHFINISSFWHCAWGELSCILIKALILPP